jgi:hypothetical protein
LPLLSLRNARLSVRAVLVSSLLPLVLSGCYTYSAFQSARVLEPGEYSITPSTSFHTYKSGSYSHWLTSQYGAEVALGVGGTERLNVTARYERLDGREYKVGADSLNGPTIDMNINYAALGIKIGLIPNHLAFVMPVGLYYGEDVSKPSDTWGAEPGLILTVPAGPFVDLNAGARLLYFFKSDVDNLVSYHLGAGLHAANRLITLFPEAGLLHQPGEDGYFTYLGIGVAFKFGTPSGR